MESKIWQKEEEWNSICHSLSLIRGEIILYCVLYKVSIVYLICSSWYSIFIQVRPLVILNDFIYSNYAYLFF